MLCYVFVMFLSCSNPILHQRLEAINIFKSENVMLQLTINPGLALTGFRTTQPWELFFINPPLPAVASSSWLVSSSPRDRADWVLALP